MSFFRIGAGIVLLIRRAVKNTFGTNFLAIVLILPGQPLLDESALRVAGAAAYSEANLRLAAFRADAGEDPQGIYVLNQLVGMLVEDFADLFVKFSGSHFPPFFHSSPGSLSSRCTPLFTSKSYMAWPARRSSSMNLSEKKDGSVEQGKIGMPG